MRLAANTGTQLHLIRPLGFNLSDNSLKRAGLDYKKDADYFLHDNFDICLNSIKFNFEGTFFIIFINSFA